MKAGLNTAMCHSTLSRDLSAMIESAANGAAASKDPFAMDWERVKQVSLLYGFIRKRNIPSNRRKMSFEPAFLKLTTELNDKLVKLDKKKGKPGKGMLLNLLME